MLKFVAEECNLCCTLTLLVCKLSSCEAAGLCTQLHFASFVVGVRAVPYRHGVFAGAWRSWRMDVLACICDLNMAFY